MENSTILNRDGLTMLTTDRTNRDRGGGLALIYKSKYKATTITKGNRPTFEFATWELKLKNSTLAVHGIYHPPPSLKNKTTNLAFIDDFLEFASNTLPEHQNSIYIGDFNLHISKDDANPAIFNDSVEAMGLYQHVGFHMHQGGNILDLIIDRVSIYRITHKFSSFLVDLIFNNVFLNTSIMFMYTPKLHDIFYHFLPITTLCLVWFSCQAHVKKVCKVNHGQNGYGGFFTWGN